MYREADPGFVDDDAPYPLAQEFCASVISRPRLNIAIYLYEPSDGGLDRVAILLANHLFQHGAHVELWMTRLDGPVAHLINPRIAVRQVAPPRATRQASMRRQFPKLAAMVRRYRPDILYSAGNQSNTLVALACWGTSTQAIARISNPMIMPGQTDSLALRRKIRYRLVSRISAATIVMGTADREFLQAPGPLAARRVEWLPRPTVTQTMLDACATRRARTAGAPVRLLMTGRLAEQKGQVTALRALASLPRSDWHLKIAGQGPLRSFLREECRRLEISKRVEFLGFVSDSQALARLMADADLFLQPSRWEGMGATMIEALACGTSVVATRCTPNIVPVLAEAGQHAPVPVDDSDAFSRAILWALDNPADPDRLADAVRPFQVDAALDAHLRLFYDLARASLPATQKI